MRSSAILLALLVAACTPKGATPVCSPVASYSAPVMKCSGSSPEVAAAEAAAAEAAAAAAQPAPTPAPEPEPAPPPPPKVEVKDDSVALADPVEFDGETAKLTDGGKAMLDDVATELKAHPEVVKLRIDARADGAGNAAAKKKSLKLANQRAAAVRTYLISKGIAGARLTAAGVAAKSADDTAGIELHITKRK